MNTNKQPEPSRPDFAELERRIRSYFLIADDGVIRLLIATAVAFLFEGDPVWVFLIAPPSGLKTELLNVLSGTEWVHFLSSLTPQTLISGQYGRGGTETSLLIKLQSKVLVFKDFTTILEMNHAARAEILAQLREVYDGKYGKHFGTGQDVSWEGKMGFIAGTTEAVDLYQAMFNILGERFLQYRITQPDRKEATRVGLSHSANIKEIRKELQELCTQYLQGIADSIDRKNPPKVPADWHDEIIDLCNFATLARTAVVRDQRMRDITHVFDAEMPVRFAKQMLFIAQALLVMDSNPDLDRKIIAKIALSSLPKKRIRILTAIAAQRNTISLKGRQSIDGDDDEGEQGNDDGGAAWTTKDIAIFLGIPTSTARRDLQDLNALRIIDRIKQGSSDAWVLRNEFQVLFEKQFADYLPAANKTPQPPSDSDLSEADLKSIEDAESFL